MLKQSVLRVDGGSLNFELFGAELVHMISEY